ncbi:MAG TPA: hypothetical protein VN894_01600, partial [Polyangiaceae bacterium]|nr:hypothetical protein [Polyangiaceae bacterium]
RRSDWSAAGGEDDVTALWARVTPDGPATTPILPLPEEPAIELPIARGEASHTMLAALANLTAAVVAVERVAMACARALDAGKGAP